jgi:hypothetical protein
MQVSAGSAPSPKVRVLRSAYFNTLVGACAAWLSDVVAGDLCAELLAFYGKDETIKLAAAPDWEGLAPAKSTCRASTAKMPNPSTAMPTESYAPGLGVTWTFF